MKFNKKFPLIIICIFIISIFGVNYGKCSDNVVIPQQTLQHRQIINTNKEIPLPPPQMPSPLPTGSTTNAAAGQGIIPVFMKMLKSLFSVIILILAMAGIVVLYRRIKSKNSSEHGEQKKEKSPEVSGMEPTNVSEAVSSFVRHKIKKTT